MTRDEAKKRLLSRAHLNHVEAGKLVDSLDALGMLKLDEPESAEERATQKALDALHHAGWDNHVLNVFDRAGLKIVEK